MAQQGSVPGTSSSGNVAALAQQLQQQHVTYAVQSPGGEQPHKSHAGRIVLVTLLAVAAIATVAAVVATAAGGGSAVAISYFGLPAGVIVTLTAWLPAGITAGTALPISAALAGGTSVLALAAFVALAVGIAFAIVFLVGYAQRHRKVEPAVPAVAAPVKTTLGRIADNAFSASQQLAENALSDKTWQISMVPNSLDPVAHFDPKAPTDARVRFSITFERSDTKIVVLVSFIQPVQLAALSGSAIDYVLEGTPSAVFSRAEIKGTVTLPEPEGTPNTMSLEQLLEAKPAKA